MSDIRLQGEIEAINEQIRTYRIYIRVLQENKKELRKKKAEGKKRK